MNPFKKAYCRIYQKVFYLASFFLPFQAKPVYEGDKGIAKMVERLSLRHFRRPMVVIDPIVEQTGLSAAILEALVKAKMKVASFNQVTPNPTLDGALELAYEYEKKCCDCLIAIGGGSTIDLAKAAGIAIVYPKKPLTKFKGVLKVHRRIPYFVAIPSTAGTGSEATLAAVVVDAKTKDKFQIDDPKLMPDMVLMYPHLLSQLPPKVVAATGMDALTHAVEAYIGHSNVFSTRRDALKAVTMIHASLLDFYARPSDENKAREMLFASYYAGRAFTRAYVGYVHALAHGLGGLYNVPHGYANAVLLPIVLKAYGKKAWRKLAHLADAIALTPSDYTDQEKAASFIAHIEKMNAAMGLPRQFDHLIQEGDLDLLSTRAEKEGNPLYPVPRIMSRQELKTLLKRSDVTWGVR